MKLHFYSVYRKSRPFEIQIIASRNLLLYYFDSPEYFAC